MKDFEYSLTDPNAQYYEILETLISAGNMKLWSLKRPRVSTIQIK